MVLTAGLIIISNQRRSYAHMCVRKIGVKENKENAKSNFHFVLVIFHAYNFLAFALRAFTSVTCVREINFTQRQLRAKRGVSTRKNEGRAPVDRVLSRLRARIKKLFSIPSSLNARIPRSPRKRLIIRGFFGHVVPSAETVGAHGPKGLAMNFDSVMKRFPSLLERVVASASDIFYCAAGLLYYRHDVRSPSRFRRHLPPSLSHSPLQLHPPD